MNTAQRIYNLLKQASGHPDKTQTVDVWSSVFGVSSKGHRRAAEVSSRLTMLSDEVELLEAQMAATDIPDDLYKPSLHRVEAAISTQSLTSSWQGHKSHITPEVMLSLRYNAAILGLQETPISDDELASLLKEVEDLESSLSNSGLSAQVLSFIQKQLTSIKQALGAYKIKGTSAIREVVRRTAGELIEYKELIAQNRDSEEVGRWGRVIQHFTKMGDAIVRTDKVLGSGQHLLEFLKDIFDSASGGT